MALDQWEDVDGKDVQFLILHSSPPYIQNAFHFNAGVKNGCSCYYEWTVWDQLSYGWTSDGVND